MHSSYICTPLQLEYKMYHLSTTAVWCKHTSSLSVKKRIIRQKLWKMQFLSHNVLISLQQLLARKDKM